MQGGREGLAAMRRRKRPKEGADFRTLHARSKISRIKRGYGTSKEPALDEIYQATRE